MVFCKRTRIDGTSLSLRPVGNDVVVVLWWRSRRSPQLAQWCSLHGESARVGCRAAGRQVPVRRHGSVVARDVMAERATVVRWPGVRWRVGRAWRAAATFTRNFLRAPAGSPVSSPEAAELSGALACDQRVACSWRPPRGARAQDGRACARVCACARVYVRTHARAYSTRSHYHTKPNCGNVHT